MNILMWVVTWSMPVMTVLVVGAMVAHTRLVSHPKHVITLPKHVVNWQHVADLEIDLLGQAYHHDSEWGAQPGSRIGSCRCEACKDKDRAKREALPKPVLERSYPVVTFSPPVSAGGGRPATLIELRQRRLHAWETAKQLAEVAAAQVRPLNKAEQLMWSNLMAQLDMLDRQILALVERQHRLATMRDFGLGNGRGCLSNCNDPTHVIDVTAIGDPEPKQIAATPEHQQYMLRREEQAWRDEYDKGRREMRRHLGLEEEW